MSTSRLFLQPDEIDGFLHDTRTDVALTVVGYEGREMGICPYVAFYVFHDKAGAPAVGEAAIQIYEEFSALIDEPWLAKMNPVHTTWGSADDPGIPADLRTFVRRSLVGDEEPFMFGATDAPGSAESARWAYYAVVDQDGSMEHSFVKLTFRNKWYVQNRERWHAFVERCIALLQPEHCYSGFEVGNGGFNILGSYEADVLERICADHFYGMDIDHPSDMCFHSYRHQDGFLNPTNLGAGLRTPTWCFLLSPIWRHKLGLSEAQVRERLADPRITITAIPAAVGPHNPQGEPLLWIRLGELSLYPVDEGVPDLLVQANALIRPIRCDRLKLNTLDPWDDDPNPRFGYQSSLDWMRRFDEDSRWPVGARRVVPPAPVQGPSRCEAGQPCPRTGWWFTPAVANSRRRFQQGEPMPDLKSAWGATIWQWDIAQD